MDPYKTTVTKKDLLIALTACLMLSIASKLIKPTEWFIRWTVTYKNMIIPLYIRAGRVRLSNEFKLGSLRCIYTKLIAIYGGIA